MDRRSFFKADDGLTVVYFGIALPAILAMMALTIDVGRGSNLQSDLQRAADALAIAAAAELDGRVDAIERADRAIANLIKNQARFTDDGAILIDASRVRPFYLDEIPEQDDSPIDNAWVAVHEMTAAPERARFAAIFIEPLHYSLLFPIAALGSAGFDVGANAVAGFDGVVCNVAPMFICNPYEGGATTLEEARADPANRRKMIIMRQKGGSSAWGPGNFGFLRTNQGGHGANALREAFAKVNPGGCFGTSGVYLNPGQVSSVRQGINVRFDIYETGMHPQTDNPEYRPALSVRKQNKSKNCNPNFAEDDDPGYRRLPRDDCFPDSCTELGGRLGDGIWDFETYWDINFPGHAYPEVDGVSWSNDPLSLPSRYQVYRYEIDNGLTGEASIGSNPSNPNGEEGAPVCYSGGTLNDIPDRRLFLGAIINCVEQADRMNGASGGPVPVAAFATFFITEPVESGPQDEIRAEIVDLNDQQHVSGLPGIGREGTRLFR